MNLPAKQILLDDSDFAEADGDVMEFRLTYAGPLHATQRDPIPGQPPKHTKNRREIRRAMHLQLKRLWKELPALSGTPIANSILLDESAPEIATSIDELSRRHSLYGFNFVPLVTEELDLMCSLDILFLRPDRPGGAVWGGDIDNRLKTLLDALRIPEAGEDYTKITPASDEEPFFCLMEDDRLLTRVSVETDRLLEPISGNYSPHDARLILTVRLRPYELHPMNMHFG